MINEKIKPIEIELKESLSQLMEKESRFIDFDKIERILKDIQGIDQYYLIGGNLMNKTKRTTIFVIILALFSIIVYGFQILVFHDPVDTKFYLLQDIGFLPIQVILVTLFLNKLLNMLESQQKMKKLNVIISAFFSAMGNTILEELSSENEAYPVLCNNIKTTEFNKSNMKDMKNRIRNLEFKMTLNSEKLRRLQLVLAERRTMLLRMLENPNLMEHDSFTDMLWSIFHLADELESRSSLDDLSQSDLKHLEVDTIRAYKALVLEWVDYMRYLHDEYPYLYSLAIRKNPFCAMASDD